MNISRNCVLKQVSVPPGSSGVFIESLNPEKIATLIINECIQCIQEFKVSAHQQLQVVWLAQTIIKTKMFGNVEEQRD